MTDPQPPMVFLVGAGPGSPGLLTLRAVECLAQADLVIYDKLVPGVTSGLAAAACAGIPVTHRQFASAVALITGHEHPGKPGSAVDWSALARFPGTLVIYMGISRLPLIVEALLAHGKDPATPA